MKYFLIILFFVICSSAFAGKLLMSGDYRDPLCREVNTTYPGTQQENGYADVICNNILYTNLQEDVWAQTFILDK